MNRLITLLFISLSSALAGCATLGPPFQAAPAAPAGKALVYFMRTSVQQGGAWTTVFSLNDVRVVSLYNRGYSWAHIDGGIYTVAVGDVIAKNYLSFQMPVREGGEYFIEYTQEPAGPGRLRNVVRAIKRDDAMKLITKYSYNPLEQATIPNPMPIKGASDEMSDEVDYVRMAAIKNQCKISGDPQLSTKPGSKNRFYDMPCEGGKMQFECGAVGSGSRRTSCWRI